MAEEIDAKALSMNRIQFFKTDNIVEWGGGNDYFFLR